MVGAIMELRTPLQIIDVSDTPTAGACGPDGCHCGHGAEDSVAAAPPAATNPGAGELAIGVVGMTCSHCVASVTEELTALDGVERVDVALAPGAVSAVRIALAGEVSGDAIRAAIEAAGYTVAD